jgi:hypothetical protein
MFFEDETRNIHSFRVISTESGCDVISIDESFEFTFNNNTLKIEVCDEFLDPIRDIINNKTFKTIDEALDSITHEYTILMDDGKSEDITPQTQIDFIEEDDFMFEKPIRFSKSDTMKLSENVLLFIFSFIEPLELVKVGRTCKKWKKLSNDETLWKNICQLRKIESTGLWKSAYIQDFITMALNFREMLKTGSGRVEKWEYFVTDFDSTKIQLRFPTGTKDIVSLSKFTPMTMIYAMSQSKLQGYERGKPFKLLFMSKVLPNDRSTLQELKILNSSLTISFQ